MQSNKQIEFFDKKANSYLSQSFNLLIRRQIIAELIGDPVGTHILDLGCGDGSVTMHLSKSNAVTFVDGASAMIAACRKNIKEYGNGEKARIVQSSIEEYEPDRCFDIIICFGVISHVEGTSALLESLHGMMSDQSILLLQFSNSTNFRYRNVDKATEIRLYGYELRRFSTEDINRHLSQVGFEIVEEAFYPWTFKGFDRFPQKLQFQVLNRMRRIRALHFLASERILLVRKRRATS